VDYERCLLRDHYQVSSNPTLSEVKSDEMLMFVLDLGYTR
jgi:hypothetical protein